MACPVILDTCKNEQVEKSSTHCISHIHQTCLSSLDYMPHWSRKVRVHCSVTSCCAACSSRCLILSLTWSIYFEGETSLNWMLANKIVHKDHTTQEAWFLNIKIVYKPCRQDTYSPRHSWNTPIKTTKITPHYIKQTKKQTLLYTVVYFVVLH